MKNGPAALNPLEKEGAVQRFEFCLELGWRTMKDYLEYGGVTIVPVSPRQVIKEAFAAGVVQEGKVWISMLEHRNLLAHTYDQEIFDKASKAIGESYLASFRALRDFLNAQLHP